MAVVNRALALSWVVMLAGVGMRWPALSWAAVGAFGAFAVAWVTLYRRAP